MNRVYVFGAGASKHANGPLIGEFVSCFTFMLCAGVYRITEHSFWRTFQIIDELTGFSIEEEARAAIREHEITVRSFVDVSRISIEWLLDETISRWGPESQESEALHDAIFETLQIRTTHSDSFSRAPNGRVLHRLTCYDRLVEYGIDDDDSITFISFNYDILADQATFINNRGIAGDYRIPFREQRNLQLYDRILRGARETRDVDLLKLHGSLNWARCPRCGSWIVGGYFRYKQLPDELCPDCGTAMLPVLVPPSSTKKTQIEHLEAVWVRASERLQAADELIVIGYSFPETDLDAVRLFKVKAQFQLKQITGSGESVSPSWRAV